jgi:hypothetical protein
MVLNRLNPEPILEPESSTIWTATTPPESVATDLLDDHDPCGGAKPSSSSVPWPGSTFIIRSVSSGDVITLRDGQVVLDRPGSRGYIHWECVETKGWLGFRDIGSGRLLGHDTQGRLRCSAEQHQGWENFCVRMTPEGGYVLLMTHWERLWQVGICEEQGMKKLVKIGGSGIVWEFVKV